MKKAARSRKKHFQGHQTEAFHQRLVKRRGSQAKIKEKSSDSRALLERRLASRMSQQDSLSRPLTEQEDQVMSETIQSLSYRMVISQHVPSNKFQVVFCTRDDVEEKIPLARWNKRSQSIQHREIAVVTWNNPAQKLISGIVVEVREARAHTDLNTHFIGLDCAQQLARELSGAGDDEIQKKYQMLLESHELSNKPVSAMAMFDYLSTFDSAFNYSASPTYIGSKVWDVDDMCDEIKNGVPFFSVLRAVQSQETKSES